MCGRIAHGFEFALQPLPRFFGLAAGPVEFGAQFGCGHAFPLGRLIRGVLGGLSGGRLGPGLADRVACLLKLGVSPGQLSPVFGFRGG